MYDIKYNKKYLNKFEDLNILCTDIFAWFFITLLITISSMRLMGKRIRSTIRKERITLVLFKQYKMRFFELRDFIIITLSKNFVYSSKGQRLFDRN